MAMDSQTLPHRIFDHQCFSKAETIDHKLVAGSSTSVIITQYTGFQATPFSPFRSDIRPTSLRLKNIIAFAILESDEAQYLLLEELKGLVD